MIPAGGTVESKATNEMAAEASRTKVCAVGKFTRYFEIVYVWGPSLWCEIKGVCVSSSAVD